jgi:hypothetical protein
MIPAIIRLLRALGQWTCFQAALRNNVLTRAVLVTAEMATGAVDRVTVGGHKTQKTSVQEVTNKFGDFTYELITIKFQGF